jgi:competence protein ComEC
MKKSCDTPRMSRSLKLLGLTLLSLLVFSVIVWSAVFPAGNGKLVVTFLDIGQGDSIFIQSPSGRQVLVDGGKGSKVLRELSAILPWYDRSIDIVVATHPDADHIGGLIDVLSRYDVDYIIRGSVEGDTSTALELMDSLRQKGTEEIIAIRGQIVELGGGAYMEILFPDREVPRVETNTGSVIARVVYGSTAFMLSGDAPDEIENYLVFLDGADLHANVLKAGHHGSKTSSGPLFLGFVAPEYGVFSRGCDNSYGHPAPEVVERFKQFAIPTADTCRGGVAFVSDGEGVERVK